MNTSSEVEPSERLAELAEPSPAPERVSRRWQEIGAASVAPLLLAALLCGLGGPALLSRTLWMDEVHTWQLVTDPDTRHCLHALAHGADYNPPTYYLLLRGLTGVDHATPALLRLVSLLAVCSGLVCCYFGLRQNFAIAPSVGAACVVAVQPHVVHQAVEARFYAVWFAALAAFCLLRTRRRTSRVLMTCECLLAVVICTVHYFGVLTLGLVACAELLTRRDWRRTAWPAWLCGLLTLAGCTPFLLGQRASLTTATWISPPTISRTVRFLTMLTPFFLLALAGGAALLKRRPATGPPEGRENRTLRDQWPLAALLMLPFVLVAFSWLVQPALVGRYAMVGLLGLAPLFALALRDVPLRVVGVFVLLCAYVGIQNVSGLQTRLRSLAATRATVLAAISENAGGGPVLFEDRIDYYPAVLEGTPASANWFLVDFDDDHPAAASALRRVQRDVGRRFQVFYPRFRTIPLEELVVPSTQRSEDPRRANSRSVFLVAATDPPGTVGGRVDEARLAREYPGYEIRHIEDRLYRLADDTTPRVWM